MANGICTLGGFQFRINPDAISYDYSINYTVIDTLGGQVIQVLGATVGDITLKGSFGEDRANHLLSWQLAENFQAQIKSLVDRQVTTGVSVDLTPHHPIDFSFSYTNLKTGEDVYWGPWKVFIKAFQDSDGQGTIEHRSGKFSYGYNLTLFMVRDSSLALAKIQSDRYIERLAKGLGWKSTGVPGANGATLTFAGNTSLDGPNGAMAFIRGYSSDGTYQGYVDNLLSNPTLRPPQPASTSPQPSGG